MSTPMNIAPETTTDAVRRFEELGKADVDYAGGKGANLGELTAAGVPVPPGFVVGAPAYAAFCDANGLRERVDGSSRGVDVEDTEALAGATERVRGLVDAGADAGVAGDRDHATPTPTSSVTTDKRPWPCAPPRPGRTPHRRPSPA